ncbi:Processive diacylglycerol beta-glucosyltransferase [compost metagenome]
MNPNKKQKILLLSGALGDGHKQAARAILEASQLYRPDVEVEIIDFMEWTHPHLHSVGKFCYLQWVKNFPSVYGYLFQKTRMDNSLSHLFKRLRSYSLDRMMKLLEEVQPTVIVSTFPPAASAMSILKSRGLTFLPTVTVITDHTDHSYWIHPCTDQYIVGSEYVRQALLRLHVSDSQIAVTGIPVRLPYSQTFERDTLRKKHKLETAMPTVLVMGGGLGMIGKDFISILKSDELSQSIQFIIVCGHNAKLRLQLLDELKYSKHQIHVVGYIDHVHEYMACSDVVVTKPGGLTTSEALALELPMILFRPLPGQEQDNAAYLVKLGAALEARDASELRGQLMQVFHHRILLNQMKNNAMKSKMKTATLHALHMILQTKTQPISVWEHASQVAYAKA